MKEGGCSLWIAGINVIATTLLTIWSLVKSRLGISVMESGERGRMFSLDCWD